MLPYERGGQRMFKPRERIFYLFVDQDLTLHRRDSIPRKLRIRCIYPYRFQEQRILFGLSLPQDKSERTDRGDPEGIY